MKALAAIAVAACGSAPAAVAPVRAAPHVVAPPRAGAPLTGIIGSRVAAPAPLDRLTPLMSVAQVLAAVPGTRRVDDHANVLAPYRLPFPAGDAADVELVAFVTADQVHDVAIVVRGADARARIEAAWGRPDLDGSHLYDPMWRSVESGWRGAIRCTDDDGPHCTVELHRLRPLADMFVRGAGIVPPDAYAKWRAGAPAAAGRRAFDGSPMADELDYDGVTVDASFEPGAGVVEMHVPTAARALVVDAWGPPTEIVGDRELWIDHATAWNATLRPDGGGLSLTFVDTQSFDRLVDTMLGLAAQPGKRSQTVPQLDVVVEPEPMALRVHVEAGHASAILDVAGLLPGSAEVFARALTTRFGAPTHTTGADGPEDHYSSHVTVTHLTLPAGIPDVDPDSLYLEVQ